MKLLSSALLLILVAACGAEQPTGAEQESVAADTVLLGGKILTVDAEFSIAAAVAIKDSRIIAVGDDETVASFVNESTKIIELQGKTVIPGLIDNHMHFIRAAQRWNLQARIDGVTSRARALEIIAEKAASMEPGEWVITTVVSWN